MGLLCKQTNIYRVWKNSDRQKNYFDLNQSFCGHLIMKTAAPVWKK